MRLGNGSDQEIEKAASLLLRGRLGEQLLELIDQEHHACLQLFRQRGGEEMQSTRGIVFQVFTDDFETAARKAGGENEGQCFDGVLPRHQGFEIYPLLAARKRSVLQPWQ